MIYLASVYSLNATTDSKEHCAIREDRYQMVMKKTAELLKDGLYVFSPIVHCHPMSNTYGMPKEFDFWMELDTHYISRCDELWVYMMEGWKESKGVTKEIAFAKCNGIPIKYIK